MIFFNYIKAPVSDSLSTDDPDRAFEDTLFVSASNKEHHFKPSNIDEMLQNFYADSNILDSSLQIDMPYLEKFNRALFQRPGSRALSVPAYFPFATINRYASSNLMNRGKKSVSKSGKSEFKYFIKNFKSNKIIFIH